MRGRRGRIVVAVLGLAVAVGLVALGRATAGGGAADPRGGYDAGFRDGRAAGVQEGRALGVVPGARDAFNAGYVAGANDAFGGYDGGWSFGVPYVVTLSHPDGPIGYRIVSRTEMVPGATYVLCPDGHGVCRR
jgi:hypothetical protein